jgi:transcriptional regulator of heat shock response
MLTLRQSKILSAVVEEYINNAIPVSSGVVFDIGILDVSCPTIRNEMADLTDMGYLIQPHTSAGRVPTELGYRFFVDKIISRQAKKPRKKSTNKISEAAHELSLETNDIVLFVDDSGEVRYSGLNKVLQKPEFSTHSAVLSIIEELDRLKVYDAEDLEKEIKDELVVFIGSENPFFENPDYSMLASRPACVAEATSARRRPACAADPRYAEGYGEARAASAGRSRDFGFIALIGPMRMNYRKNLELLKIL